MVKHRICDIGLNWSHVAGLPVKEQIAVNSSAEVAEVRFEADKSVLFPSLSINMHSLFLCNNIE